MTTPPRGAGDRPRPIIERAPLGAILTPPALEPWRADWQRFLRARGTVRRPIPTDTARAHLQITRTADTHTALAGLGAKQVPMIVENVGSVASYTCVVRALEARVRDPIYEQIPLSQFALRGQLTLTLQPGERATVTLPFERTLAAGTFVALVSDPLTDPNEQVVADWNHRRILLVNLV